MRYDILLKSVKNKIYLVDNIRRKEILFTPEEEVRQNFIKLCIEDLHYPIERINVEKKVKGSPVNKRFDIIIYKDMAPWMLVECKAPNITITKDTLLQILNYNTHIKAEYIVLTNGINTYCLNAKSKTPKWVNKMPIF